MSGARSFVIAGVQSYAWAAFFLAWLKMGWVDWTQQKIRNRYLKIWLGLAAAGYAVLACHSLLGRQGLASSYLLGGYYADLAVYLVFSIASAYAFWALRIWPAGDVKLFSLLALYYPLMLIPGSFRSGTRFLEILINIFLPAAAFLFLTSSEYLWRTRFNEQKKFYWQMGLGKLLPYALVKSEEAWTVLRAELKNWAQAYQNPWKLLAAAASWLSMMAVMSMVSYYLNDLISSNLIKTLVCFALFFTWSRFCQLIGKRWALALAFAVFLGLLISHPELNWGALGQAFGHISIFSLCIFFGIQLAFKVVAGQSGFIFLPLLFMLPSLIPWWWIGRSSERVAGHLWSGAHAAAARFGDFFVWAGMGLFFGASLVFVKIWDGESYKSLGPDQIEPFMTLGPSMVALIELDEAFRDEHFQTFYADGLTREQVDALREWCQRHGIERVPLAPTISFANWIFLGYLLTLLLNGHLLQKLY